VELVVWEVECLPLCKTLGFCPNESAESGALIFLV